MNLNEYTKDQLLQAIVDIEKAELEAEKLLESQEPVAPKILVGTRGTDGKIHHYRVDAADYAEAQMIVRTAMTEDEKVKNPVALALIRCTPEVSVECDVVEPETA